MLSALDISASGLESRRLWMNTIAENIANAETTRDAYGKINAYRRHPDAGSALAADATAVAAFLTTNTASAAAMLAWVFFDAVQGHQRTITPSSDSLSLRLHLTA